MGQIADAFAEAFRDFVTDGLAASGDHEPEKSAIRPIGPLIESAIANVALAAMLDVTKSTRALLDADLAHGANTVALVYADSSDANNDLYVKVGGSGSGSWTLTGILHGIIDALTHDVVTATENATTALLDALAAFDADKAAVLLEAARSSRSAVWEPELGYLYQDAAGTVPVTAVGDPVGCIKRIAGSSDYDWIQADNAKRGSYVEVYGRGVVRMNNGQGYYSRANVTMPIPASLFVAGKYAGTTGRTIMGFAKNTGTRFQINSTSLSRVNSSTTGISPDLVRPLADAYCPDFLAPSGTDGVYHGQIAATGIMDSFAEDTTVLSGAGPATIATGWASGNTVASMSLTLNGGSQSLGIGVVNADASLDFYGGAVLGTEAGDRGAFIRWLQSRTRPGITENDEVILIIGDSTGDDVSQVPDRIQEVFYKLANDDLPTRRPANCVLLQDWSRVGDTFQGMTRLSDGTKTRRTFVINCSSAGSQPGYFFSERFERAIGRLPKVDLAIFHHGQNLAIGDLTIQAATNRGLLKAGQYIDTIDQLRGRFPDAKLMLVKPYPYGVDGDERIEPVKKAVEFVATKYPDAVVADYYTVFDTGTGGESRPAAWYEADHVHPSNPTGIGKMYDVIVAAMNTYDALSPSLFLTPPLIGHRRILPSENLLANGSFETWTGGVPDSWSLTGDGAVTKVGTKARISASDGGLAQTITATALAGKTVVLAVSQDIATGSDVWAGGVRFMTDNAGVNIGDGRWVDQPYRSWEADRLFYYYFPVPAGATTLTVEILGGAEGAGVTRVSRAVLVGEDPKDILI